MDLITPIWFGVDLDDRLLAGLLRRPWLSVSLATLRLDSKKRRWVLRAGVTNRGIMTAKRCEAFWTVFDPRLKDVESSTSVYWSPLTDDDYDFQNRDLHTVDIEPHERRFCWADMPLDVHLADGAPANFFPGGDFIGPHALAVVVQYGQFKAFDYTIVDMSHPFGGSDKLFGEIEVFDVGLGHARTVRELRRWCTLCRFIRTVDYHQYVRPT
jgi:hypothetical protein